MLSVHIPRWRRHPGGRAAESRCSSDCPAALHTLGGDCAAQLSHSGVGQEGNMLAARIRPSCSSLEGPPGQRPWPRNSTPRMPSRGRAVLSLPPQELQMNR